MGTITVEHHCDTGHYAVTTVDLILCRVEVSCETLGRSEETFVEEGPFVHSFLRPLEPHERVGHAENSNGSPGLALTTGVALF